MDEQNIMQQISRNIERGRFETNSRQFDAEKKRQLGIPDLINLSMQENIPPELISDDVLDKAMDDSIQKYETGEYKLPELAIRAKCTGDARDLLQEYIEDAETISKGKIMLATVEGDKHGQGKKIASLFLRAIGYHIVDLGIDVPVDKIIRSVEYHKPDYLGISASIVSTVPEIEILINTLSEKEFGENVKVILGGTLACQEYAESIDADYRCSEINHTIALLKELSHRN